MDKGKEFVYMVIADNKPLNALHQLKDKNLVDNSVFELLRELYFNRLQSLIDKQIQEKKKEREKLYKEFEKNKEKISIIAKQYKNLKMINLVRYEDNSKRGEFTKKILERIDDIISREESLLNEK